MKDMDMSNASILKITKGKNINKIILIQRKIREFFLRRNELILFNINKLFGYKVTRVSICNFTSLINEKIQYAISGVARLDSLGEYDLNHMTQYFGSEINLDKILKDFDYRKNKLGPVMIIKSQYSFWREFYWGEWNSQGCIEGFGYKIYSNGNFYIGSFKNNKMHGIGVYIFADKSKDLFKNPKISKEDHFKFIAKYSKDIADKKLYETVDKSAKYKYSLFREKKNFYKLNFEANNREYFTYQGEFKNDKLEGFGNIFFRNKIHFKGFFKDNSITTKGRYVSFET